MRSIAAGALIAAAMLAAGAPAGRADVEEFATFAIGPQEQDDESALDHFLTRFPRAWSQAWLHSTAGLRTSQGCLTSGEWFIDTDLRARAPLGERAWLGIDYFQSESDILRDTRLDLSFHFPVGPGAAMAMFRPSAEKAAQDFALGWEMGADTSAFQMRAVWTLEDVFNNFWAFRQTQVGGLSEPYERRPYEPALFLATRHPGWSLEAGAKWLTPSAKRVVDLASAQPLYRRELWGAAGRARAEVALGPLTFEAATDQRQARGHDLPLGPAAVEMLGYRRQWSAEAALRAAPDARTTVEARWMYLSRFERTGLAGSEALLAVDDRILNLDIVRELHPRVTLRTGALYDRVGVSRIAWPTWSWGTRTESRAYVGLFLRFGRVLVSGIEGIELDPELYDVWLVHDKGFLQLQTTF